MAEVLTALLPPTPNQTNLQSSTNSTPQKPPNIWQHARPNGRFIRPQSAFRNHVSRDPSSPFPAEKDRYVLYLNLGCPWAHRTNIVRSLKGLESVIPMSVMDPTLTAEGWVYTGKWGTEEKDPLYGFTKIRQFYLKADPDYEGRFTVPMLWDKKTETVVNNESSEIIRMMYTEFDDLIPEERRESMRPLLPEDLKEKIEEMNGWVYDTVNNGVYKTGFATTQDAYEENLYPLFKSLDRLEEHLGEKGHSPFLFGEHVTEADVRLYATIIRFDVAYYLIFRCNLKMIRYEYPNLHTWLRRLYWDKGPETNGGAFGKTTEFYAYKWGYANSLRKDGQDVPVIPAGPVPDILPL